MAALPARAEISSAQVISSSRGDGAVRRRSQLKPDLHVGAHPFAEASISRADASQLPALPRDAFLRFSRISHRGAHPSNAWLSAFTGDRGIRLCGYSLAILDRRRRSPEIHRHQELRRRRARRRRFLRAIITLHSLASLNRHTGYAYHVRFRRNVMTVAPG